MGKYYPRSIDLTGQVFDRFTVICEVDRTKDFRRWKIRCECGREKIAYQHFLKIDKGIFCKCKERPRNIKTHRQCGTSEHWAWKAIRSRTTNSKHVSYGNYGGRGIVVCRGWEDFSLFLLDVGPKPTPKHTLDRINNDGNYSCGHCEECLANGWPANCRWATYKEQMNNKRGNVFLTHDGERLTVQQWSEKLNINKTIIAKRKRRGLSDAESLAIPKKRNKT